MIRNKYNLISVNFIIKQKCNINYSKIRNQLMEPIFEERKDR